MMILEVQLNHKLFYPKLINTLKIERDVPSPYLNQEKMKIHSSHLTPPEFKLSKLFTSDFRKCHLLIGPQVRLLIR